MDRREFQQSFCPVRSVEMFGSGSEIIRRQTSASGDTSQHARSDFFILMEGKDEIRPARA
jgi:hypothetical protein